jgi:putative hydrolase of the HAD superfamily
MARALIIDLDDTLFNERDYVLSGFHAVAAEVARRRPPVAAATLHAAMVQALDANGRGKVFDRALVLAGVEPEPALLRDLVEVYRDHRPQIALWPGVAATLGQLARDHHLAIVTDGLQRMQARKVEALGVAALVGEVIYCWEMGAPKPDPRPFQEALRRLGAQAGEAVVIGDNPAHDMAAAAAVGCRSIRVRAGRFAALGDLGFPADAEAPNFNAVPAILDGPQFGEIA